MNAWRRFKTPQAAERRRLPSAHYDSGRVDSRGQNKSMVTVMSVCYRRSARRGNRQDRLSEEVRKLMSESIEQDFESRKQKSKYAAWIAFKHKCEQRGIAAPSYKTFRLSCKRRSRFDQTLKRKGHRAAYIHEPAFWSLDLTTPRHGDRPFDISHIDHTELDIELVCSVTSQVLGRPWLTLLVDAFSRRLLALYLTFDPPSYRSCMMVLRNCVKRHQRLPQTLVVDGGREFESTYFETLLARYECTKKTRPPAKARFGSVCERLFGTTNTQFVHNLSGNTQITKDVRQVTSSVNPKRLATWSLGDLHQRLTEYLFEIYDRMEHPALGQSPREAFARGLEAGGLPSGVTQKRPCRVTSKPAMLEVQDRSSDWGAGSLGWHGQCLERSEAAAGDCAGAAGLVATAD